MMENVSEMVVMYELFFNFCSWKGSLYQLDNILLRNRFYLQLKNYMIFGSILYRAMKYE